MRLEGKITHGITIDCAQDGLWAVCVNVGGTQVALCNTTDFEVILAFGPIGTFVDMSNYYQRSEIDNMMQQKQNNLVAGKDIYINGNVIDNEHNFFTNQEIQDVWDIIMDNN